ncbi:hypothetical protein KQI46_11705 [Lysinibacillus capsici]|uniref:hypothetical protein n=1 Tax=Lysinibacillus capsici TaxID=2115968 RepID=UPI001C103F2B|nr:hypothetical protein [Lysinibacillus capsici]MBU5252563.1 hypothetical protein [Lysinibacillus capsici]
MDINQELKIIESLFDFSSIKIKTENVYFFPMELTYFELSQFSDLIIKLNKERFECQSFEDKSDCLEKYKKIYLSQRKTYNRLLKNLDNGAVSIIIPEINKEQERYATEILNFDISIPFEVNVKDFMRKKLKQRLCETNEELYKLKHYPNSYINAFSNFVGPNSILKYKNDIVFYKDVYIASTESHSYSVFYNEKTEEKVKRALLNILAYFNGQPFFYFTENYNFNRKLMELYEQFDLLDMLRLRKKDFFVSKEDEPNYCELPVLKRKKNYDFICLEDSQHEMIFELYHASLKQFESLPRCVFLYRVFEYGAKNHYQRIFNPPNYRPEDALNYYVNEIMKHNFVPLYYVDSGFSYNIREKTFIDKRKSKYVNFTSALKKEVKKIKDEWSNHNYLKTKNAGEIIYVTGRNAAAHGGSGENNARYDYDSNYKHINDVNIFLELIARYLIEVLNPQFSNIVERRTKYYDDYKRLNERKESE